MLHGAKRYPPLHSARSFAYRAVTNSEDTCDDIADELGRVGAA